MYQNSAIKMNCIVIIADIIDSKKLPDRNSVQSSLRNRLEEINRTSQTLLSPFTITLGDEFQAVYEKSTSLLRDLLYITIKLFPVRIRFTVSYGTISTEINTKEAIGMDGPAFYSAREGMEYLKKKTNYSIIQLYGLTGEHMDTINSGLNLCMSLMAEWKQNTLLVFHELTNGKSVNEIAAKLHITNRGVYKTLTVHKLRNFVDFFLSLENEIGKIEVA
jgi:hypothetical protein